MIKRLSSESVDEQLAGLHRAATYYKVIRNFKNGNEDIRLNNALSALMAVPQITQLNVSNSVISLAQIYEEQYEQHNLSAASKFLWLRFKSPIIIFDSRALKCLYKIGNIKRKCSYDEYRLEWLRNYSIYKDDIESACKKLVIHKNYSLANNISDEELSIITSNQWFKERVFDKFLWFNSDDS